MPLDHVSLNLSGKDLQSYSLQRAIAGMISTDRNSHKGIEAEISDEIRKQLNRPGGFFIPTSLPIDGAAANRGAAMLGRRAVYTATGNAGALVGQQFETDSFINALRAKSRTMQLGARLLPNLVGNVAIPKAQTGATAAWLTPEGSDATEDESTFAQIRMTPHNIASYAQMTRGMVASISEEMEQYILADLARGAAVAIDLACIAGTGANGEPTGVLNTSGIGTVAIGTNGGPVTLAALEALETTVTGQNVDSDAMAYLVNPAQVGKMRGLVDSAGHPVWQWSPNPMATPAHAPGFLNGYAVARSSNVPANLTKGTGTNLSAIIFGNWSDLVVGEWGYMELSVNAFGPTFASGGLELRAIASVDVALRHPEAFAAITDAS